ncbi:MAG: NUDIX hydrolase [Actinobacteria bacterium]|nr:NUDIX hydrolase [Actinomycetota bacterium]
MFKREDDVIETENKLGRPTVARMHYELSPVEFDVVEGSMGDGRDHDVTMFIRNGQNPNKIAVIRKPFFPEPVFRAPSGAATLDEPLIDGAVREAHEETGLDIELIRYLVRINVKFTSGGRLIDWTSHIFEARHVHGDIQPIDTDEIAEARWATLEELVDQEVVALPVYSIAVFSVFRHHRSHLCV